MKILNLYAGIGGNRKLWRGAHTITSVELDRQIAEVYEANFSDMPLTLDAHQYLLNYFKEFDFIWSSPPCQTHSSFRHNICVRFRGTKPEYPDMRLYQEILFLKHHFKGKWVVENVKPYYEPLIKPDYIIGRHYFWSNFEITPKEFKKHNIRGEQIKDLEKRHGFDLSQFKLKNKRQVLRNCVDPEIGQHILNCAIDSDLK